MDNTQIAFDYITLLMCQLKQNHLSLDEINKHLKNIDVLLGDRLTPWPDDFQAMWKEAPDLNEMFVIKQR
ncbi:hypothetical protein [Vibrio parahaemolyticus]|uniref:hypothetical protein n=1 Tax=Vibrio parahaemolyticus TaxID=670 RepID=UPI000A1FDDDB|nr:hypothetical protein [Vibrio parahaemolyticus]